MTTPLEKWLSEVKTRVKKATPGPWLTNKPHKTEMRTVCGEITMDDGSKVPTFDWIIGYMQVSNCPNYREDADFIAAAPTDLKKAVRIIEALVNYEDFPVVLSPHTEDGIRINKIAAMSDKEFWE